MSEPWEGDPAFVGAMGGSNRRSGFAIAQAWLRTDRVELLSISCKKGVKRASCSHGTSCESSSCSLAEPTCYAPAEFRKKNARLSLILQRSSFRGGPPAQVWRQSLPFHGIAAVSVHKASRFTLQKSHTCPMIVKTYIFSHLFLTFS